MDLTAFSLIPVGTIKSGYPFLLQCEGFDSFDEWDDENDFFLVTDGTVRIDGHFRIDIYEDTVKQNLHDLLKLPIPDGSSIVGIFISGDLLIEGCLINAEGDYGPFMYVNGSVQCQSMLLGGACIVINRDITAGEVVFTSYNHGYMCCRGIVRSPVLIIEDHDTHISEHITPLFYYNDRTDDCPPENECYDDGSDYICSDNLLRHLDNPLTRTFEELKRDMVKGEHVLKGQQETIRDKGYWIEKVHTDYHDLKRIPAQYRDKELYVEAVEKNYHALPLIPDEWITDELCRKLVRKDGSAIRVIPPGFLTAELCMLAAENGTLLSFIPQKFYSEELILTVFANSQYEPDIKDVPSAFITENLLIEYVKLGKGLWLDKVCTENGLDKKQIIEMVIDGGIRNLDCIFGYHCSDDAFGYAAGQYNTPPFLQEWERYMEKYRDKLTRLGLLR